MQAAVMYKPMDIRVEDVATPDPPPNHALVRVAAVGVCGSDIPRMLYKGAHNMPLICGHEFSGFVTASNGDIGDVAIGDLVTVPPLIPCFTCDQCQRGNPSRCSNYDYFGSRRDGAYAEYVVVPATNLTKVPATMDPTAAAMVDPAAIALHALWKTNLRVGSRVAVVGCGPIGLFAIQWCRLMGAREILAVDIDPMKIGLATEAGATFGATTPEEALEFGAFDVVLEAAGHPSSINASVRLAGPGGHVVFIGIPVADVELQQQTFEHFLRHEVSLFGAWNSFSMPFPGDAWRAAIDKLTTGELKWKFMVSHDLPLAELPDVFRKLKEHELSAAKIIFRP